VAGTLSDLYGPRAIFAVMAVMVCLALALLPAIRLPAPELVPSEAELMPVAALPAPPAS
jgi:hypothetical protein